MEAMTKAGEQGCRVVAVDRPPFGLSQRPLQWQDRAPDSNPYTNAVRHAAGGYGVPACAPGRTLEHVGPAQPACCTLPGCVLDRTACMSDTVQSWLCHGVAGLDLLTCGMQGWAVARLHLLTCVGGTLCDGRWTAGKQGCASERCHWRERRAMQGLWRA